MLNGKERMLTLDCSHVEGVLTEAEILAGIERYGEVLDSIEQGTAAPKEDLGWLDIPIASDAQMLEKIHAEARKAHDNADVFLLIGIGGSNQGARAVIQALAADDSGPDIIYTGNTLSPYEMKTTLDRCAGKSVYANIIAKNFATLEPGISFRVIRKFLEDTYGAGGAAERVVATASLNGSSLQKLAEEKGYALLPFPLDVGGRFSVLTPVGLFPIAVAGLDIKELLEGALCMSDWILKADREENPAVRYAVIRNLLHEKDYQTEIVSYFDPRLRWFSSWWAQLFGESEGKDGTGIFPATCAFSEDLHSLGQYIQQGHRNLFETFLHLEDQGAKVPICPDPDCDDEFDYLDGSDFAHLNEMAYRGTLKAHSEGGVPCMVLNLPQLDAHTLGQLFFFFEYACFVSASILGVNPFNQPGVEAYKRNMFDLLGK